MSDKVKIFEQQLSEKCKFTIIVGGVYSNNPKSVMDEVISNYVGDSPHNQWIDIKLNNPWTRVITGDIRDLPFENFKTFLKRRERKEKLNKINEISK